MTRILLLCLVGLIGFSTADTLYDKSDPILELDQDTFDAAVYGTKKAHFIEFYSSWCGACIGYAPVFKKFARHLQSWAPLVQVTVVNCADDKNSKLCREHSIGSFPTLKYFKYNSANKDDGLVYKGQKHDLPAMELDVAGLVQSDYQQQKPEGWPSFDPVDSSKTLDDLWAGVTTNYLGVAIQENPATMGWANIINFHNDRHVKVVLVRPQNVEAVKQLGTSANNRFLLYAKGNPTPVYTSPESPGPWSDIQEKVNELVSVGAPPPPVPSPVRVEPVLVEQQGAAPATALGLSQYQVQLVDLQSAMSYMLYKEIPRTPSIEGENLAGLKQWIHTLKKYAPGTTPMRRLFYRLDEWLQVKMDKVTADEWMAKLDEIQQALGNPIPKEITWLACAGSKSHLRGYTCGLWTLAHAVTVEAYKAEQHSPAFRPVVDVLEPFKQFITRFLSCSECSQNFAKEAEKHQLHLVTRPEDVISWLWKVHNYVNQRLSGSPSDDPKFPKQQFPPKALCPHCYGSDGSFLEKETFDFVKSYYGDIRQDTAKGAPGYKVNEYKDGQLKAVGSRHLNPKFAIHAEKVEKLEAAEALQRKDLDGSPQRQWRDIEGYDAAYDVTTGRTHYYFIWLTVIGIALIFAYCKYRRNRSKFWKTFYYHNDFKLCPWSSENTGKKYTA